MDYSRTQSWFLKLYVMIIGVIIDYTFYLIVEVNKFQSDIEKINLLRPNYTFWVTIVLNSQRKLLGNISDQNNLINVSSNKNKSNELRWSSKFWLCL